MNFLQGITVVALEHAVAGPLATRHLADLGARVIKVERPGTGDFARSYDRTVKGMSSHFVWLNRGKESITLDVKAPGDRRVLDALLDRADVFLQNLAPGATGRLGLSATTLRGRYPKLVVCDISGYGTSGPYRDKKAYDLLVQCEAGLVSITGSAGEPAKVGIPVADIATGMYAYSGILAALFERERTGTGCHLEVAMLDALAEWMGYPYYYTAYGGAPPPRTGAHHAAIAPYGPYATATAEVFLAVQSEREWCSFRDHVLRRPELAADARLADNTARVTHHDHLTAIIEDVLRGLSAEEVERRLDEAGIAHAALRSVVSALDHPQLRWREVDSPVGPLRTLQPPVRFAGHEPRLGPVPALGEHDAAIRGQLPGTSP